MNPLKSFLVRLYEKPSIPLALFFVILPWIFNAIISFILIGPDAIGGIFGGALSLLAFNLILWFFVGLGLYIVLRGLKGAELSGKLTGVLTAFSFVLFLPWIGVSISTIIVLLVLLFVFPSFLSNMQALSGTFGGASTEQIVAEIASLSPELSAGLSIVVIIGFILAALLFIVLFFLGLYLLYSLISLTKKSSVFKNIIIFVIAAGFYILVDTVYNLALDLLVGLLA